MSETPKNDPYDINNGPSPESGDTEIDEVGAETGYEPDQLPSADQPGGILDEEIYLPEVENTDPELSAFVDEVTGNIRIDLAACRQRLEASESELDVQAAKQGLQVAEARLAEGTRVARKVYENLPFIDPKSTNTMISLSDYILNPYTEKISELEGVIEQARERGDTDAEAAAAYGKALQTTFHADAQNIIKKAGLEQPAV